ncbi:hypothetical protein HHK36_005502 [Tetracentron sinense]|uniref:non-specific serine/threonine protein kinase n=1 Tax=Tetracentron sinense TaxID=13715 RepID=A0A835DMV9_TETSI|nr:hypothetical protein HHK36_005502 [Tetracentron sinense]
MDPGKWSLKALLFFLLFPFCSSSDTITPTQPITDGDILLSTGEDFALGFFSPGSSRDRYLGIWYNKVSEQTVVWVANRESPIKDSSGVFMINGDGNLVVVNRNQSSLLWSTNITVATNDSIAKLSNSGIWYLPGMKMGLNRKTGLNWFLTSWKSRNDPARGNFSYALDPRGSPQFFVYRDSAPYWRTGPWNGHRWSGVPVMTQNFIFKYSLVNDEDGIYTTYTLYNESIFSTMMLDDSGSAQRLTWVDGIHRWNMFWSAPGDQCDNYGLCGPYGSCTSNTELECSCLPGFEPKSPRDWYLKDGSAGCVRKRESSCGKGEGFVKLERLKLPDTSMSRVDRSLSLLECQKQCLSNCSCTAYSSADLNGGGSGCMAWYGELMDIRDYPNDGQDLYVRVDAIELAAYARRNSKGFLGQKRNVVILILSIVAGFFLLASSGCCLLKKKKRETKVLVPVLSLPVRSPEISGWAGGVEIDGTLGIHGITKESKRKSEAMDPKNYSLNALILFLVFPFCTSRDTITPIQPITEGHILVSKGENFALGFFSPGSSRDRYIGIWYNKVTEPTVVWVANRESPIKDSSGVLMINGDGNLVVASRNQSNLLWSTNITVATMDSIAKLSNSGNFVLIQNNSKKVVWQSFDFPTHTYLPCMKIGLNRKTGLKWFLTSWKSPNDPARGNFSYALDPRGSPQLFVYRCSTPYWRSGPWNGRGFSGVPEMTQSFVFKYNFVSDQDEVYSTYTLYNDSIFTALVLDNSGTAQMLAWVDGIRRWNLFSSSPRDQCDHYGLCGPYGSCSSNTALECRCLPGFEPKSPRDWYLRDGSAGCVRKRESSCGKGEGFLKLERVKLPDTSMSRVERSLSLQECQKQCLSNCSCTAYSSADVNGGGSGCVTWYGELMDIRDYPKGGQDLYVRVDAIELAANARRNSKGFLGQKRNVVILIVSIVAGLFLLVSCGCFLLKKKRTETKGKAMERRHEWLFGDSLGTKELDQIRHGTYGMKAEPWI